MEGQWGIYAGLEKRHQGRGIRDQNVNKGAQVLETINKQEKKGCMSQTVIFNCAKCLDGIKGPGKRAVGFFLSLI